MNAQIIGTTLPVLEIGLQPGDKLISEPGQFSWMSSNVNLTTAARTGGATSLFGAIGRALSGGGLFMNEYHVDSGDGLVAFAAKVPGQIIQVDLDVGTDYMIHRHGFLAGTEGINLQIGFQKSLGAGLFGGDGFILQKLSGTGASWVELGGEVVTYDLTPGETIRVHPGHVGMFDHSVNFNLGVIRGIKNVIFGGDGLFVADLTGPGRVWLQSLTMPNLAGAIAPYLGEARTSATAVGAGVGGSAGGLGGAMAGGVIGAVLGNILGGEE